MKFSFVRSVFGARLSENFYAWILEDGDLTVKHFHPFDGVQESQNRT